MEAIIIRNAVPADKAALEDLQLRASLANEADREAILAHPDAIDLPLEQLTSGDVFVLELGGRIAGFAALLLRPDGDADLDGLFVEPDMRRRGAGRALVEHCAKISLGRGARVLHVVGNFHAEAFYLSCGFKAIGLYETRFGRGLLMRKELIV